MLGFLEVFQRNTEHYRPMNVRGREKSQQHCTDEQQYAFSDDRKSTNQSIGFAEGAGTPLGFPDHGICPHSMIHSGCVPLL
jgi:hypothetical protein